MVTEWINYTENEWYKLKDKYSIVKIWKIGLSSKERKKRGIGAYGFIGRLSRDGIETKKTFKKESEALKFAKEYMNNN